MCLADLEVFPIILNKKKYKFRQGTLDSRFPFGPRVLKEQLHMLVDLVDGCPQSQVFHDWGDDLFIGH